MIMSVLGLEDEFELQLSGDKYKYPELVSDSFYGELFHRETMEYLIVPFSVSPKIS